MRLYDILHTAGNGTIIQSASSTRSDVTTWKLYAPLALRGRIQDSQLQYTLAQLATVVVGTPSTFRSTNQFWFDCEETLLHYAANEKHIFKMRLLITAQ